MTTPSPCCEFAACNETELYQVCRRVGIKVTPTTTKEKMIAYLEGEEDPPAVVNVFDTWRDALMQFILDHWVTLETQLRCPAKSGDPRSCYQCVDAQVISCVVQQDPHSQKLIELRRK